MLFQQLEISEINEEVKGFKTIVFAGGHDLHYQPGQYLTFVHQHHNQEIRRSYSLVSSPALEEPLTIGVKRVANGAFSRLLVDRAKPGDHLVTTGAGGFFTLPENLSAYQQVFFFAAGSGITPTFSLIKTLLVRHPHLSVVLIYSTPSAAQTAFYLPLLEYAGQYPQFHLRFLFSNAPDLRMARLNRDLLIELLDRHVKQNRERTLFYICGPESYMRLCTYTLQEESVPKENIRRENFIIEKKQPPKAIPPDTETHFVTIQQGETRYRFPSTYPDTILQSAKKQGIELPYSCETGRCGNCAARCTGGKVWLSYNEVLTEKDLAEGLTLTCVGYPIGGDVLLKV
jgi:ring-1,2-phenylacetyl-CoA epoxidase subunit PaaE